MRAEEKGVTEDEMVGWHHQLSGHELEQTLGVKDMEAWSAEVHRVVESDITEQLKSKCNFVILSYFWKVTEIKALI